MKNKKIKYENIIWNIYIDLSINWKYDSKIKWNRELFLDKINITKFIKYLIRKIDFFNRKNYFNKNMIEHYIDDNVYNFITIINKKYEQYS